MVLAANFRRWRAMPLTGRNGPVGVCQLLLYLASAIWLLFTAIPLSDRLLDGVGRAAVILPLLAPGAVAIIVAGFFFRDRLLAGAGLLALLLATYGLYPEWAAAESNAENHADLTIVTHNLAVTNRDPAQTVDMLMSSGADILLLQETNGRMEPFLNALDTVYPYHSQCTYGCGLKIYSHMPIEPVQWRLRDKQGEETGPGLVWAKSAIPEVLPFTILTLHQSRNRNAASREAERRGLANAMSRLSCRYCILAGDFNLTPWEGGMRRLEQGLAPLRRVTRGLFSYPAFIPRIGRFFPLLPIDHVFVGPGWRVISVDRLDRTGSDHFPVRVRLARDVEIKAAQNRPTVQ